MAKLHHSPREEKRFLADRPSEPLFEGLAGLVGVRTAEPIDGFGGGPRLVKTCIDLVVVRQFIERRSSIFHIAKGGRYELYERYQPSCCSSGFL